MKTSKLYRQAILATLSALTLSGGACGNSSSNTSQTSGSYLASTNVPSGDDYLTLVGYLNALATGQAELTNATEHAGFAGVLRSPAVPRSYFVGSGEAPTIQRFDEENGVIVPKQIVSFANLGLTYAPGATETAFDEAGLAYSVSVDQALVVVWNAKTMEIVHTIPLPGLAREGYSPVYPLSTVLREGKLVFPVSHTNFDSGASLPLTTLVVVDVATSQAVLSDDTRCSGLRGFSRAADGTLYGATDGFFAVRRRLYGSSAGTEPCVMRVLPGQTSFDANYLLPSRALFDASIVGDLSITADGQSVLLNVFDEQASPISADAAYGDVARAAGWRVHRAPIAALTTANGVRSTPVDGLPIGARQGIRFNVSGRSWVAIASADYGSSQLWDVTSAVTMEGPRFTGSVSTIYAL